MYGNLFESVLVAVADPDDARSTARAVAEYLGPESELIVAHVVPKGEGVPDKVSVEQREQYAEEAYQVFLDELPRDGRSMIPLTLYGRDVGEALVEGAIEAGASIIVFTPRGASRWTKLLAGSVADDLVTNERVPVLVLPDPTTPDD